MLYRNKLACFNLIEVVSFTYRLYVWIIKEKVTQSTELIKGEVCTDIIANERWFNSLNQSKQSLYRYCDEWKVIQLTELIKVRSV